MLYVIEKLIDCEKEDGRACSRRQWIVWEVVEGGRSREKAFNRMGTLIREHDRKYGASLESSIYRIGRFKRLYNER